MRFSLVDRIASLEPAKSITAIKNLTSAEEYLADHFPGFPVMPGVLMLETLVQAGAWLMRHTEDFRYSTILLRQARGLRFNNLVTPGNSLIVTATVQKRGEREYEFKGQGTVNDTSAVSVRFILEQFNVSENNPALESSDKQRIQSLRETFGQIWNPSPEKQAVASA